MHSRNFLTLVLFLALFLSGGSVLFGKPLQVFILAGQSNMQGHAKLSTMDYLETDPRTVPILKDLRNPDGSLRECRQVWISSIGCAGENESGFVEQTGKLTAGFGANPNEIGPEYTFGVYMEKALDAPILIIKTSWGGRSLRSDFRSPGSGPLKISDFILERWRERNLNIQTETENNLKNVGVTYGQMMTHVKKVLGNIQRVVPDYKPEQGYRLAGFVWFQGWNDYCDSWAYNNQSQPGGYDEYTKLMRQFILDVRKDLSTPNLPFVIGVMGVDGKIGYEKAPMKNFRQAQAAAADFPEFKGNVTAVETAPFWIDSLAELGERMNRLNGELREKYRDVKDKSPAEIEAECQKIREEKFSKEELKAVQEITNGGYHYMGNARTMTLIGKAFADAMIKMDGCNKL